MPDRRSTLVAAGVVLMLAVIGGLYWIGERADQERLREEQSKVAALEAAQDAENAEAQARAEAAAGRRALRVQCNTGITSACDQLAALPVPAEVTPDAEVDNTEVQDPEVQEGEVQDPERQDGERNDPDPDDPETQDPEGDDAETQDDEVQDGETDDPEVQDPEIQDEETQDPEVDDPDPNSALTYRARDDCNPSEGETAIDYDLTVEVDANTVTYVLTCTTAPTPGPVAFLR